MESATGMRIDCLADDCEAPQEHAASALAQQRAAARRTRTKAAGTCKPEAHLQGTVCEAPAKRPKAGLAGQGVACQPAAKRVCGPETFEVPALFYEGSAALRKQAAPAAPSHSKYRSYAAAPPVVPVPEHQSTHHGIRAGAARSSKTEGARPSVPVDNGLQALPAAFLEGKQVPRSAGQRCQGAPSRSARPPAPSSVIGPGPALPQTRGREPSPAPALAPALAPAPASAPASARAGAGAAQRVTRPKAGSGLGEQVRFEDLAPGQQTVFRMLVHEDKNVLMLGEGGTGKSLTIAAIAAELKRRKVPFLITASTGRAALLIGGTTVHSAFGIGLGTGTAEELVTRVSANAWVTKELRKAKVVVIDEVSMVSAELLFKLDYLTRAVRRNFKEPFGGMRVLGSGDMMQLPPVKAEFCFLHPCFPVIFPPSQCIELKHNFRQDQDAGFRKLLEAVRWGRVTPEVDAALQARVGLLPPAGVPATVIYPLRQQVDALNYTNMEALPGETKSFRHEFTTLPGLSDRQAGFLHAMLLSSAPCCDVLGLKVGAQVMHTRNNKETGKVNGSLGTVAGFGPLTGHPIVNFADGTTHSVAPHGWTSPCHKATLVQYPLIVAWAVTIHKIQGATLDAVVADVGESVFEAGQAYTALSRVRRLEDLYLVAWNAASARPHPAAIAFYASLADAQAAPLQ